MRWGDDVDTMADFDERRFVAQVDRAMVSLTLLGIIRRLDLVCSTAVCAMSFSGAFVLCHLARKK